MRLTIKVSGDLSAFGIAISQNRIGWIALAIGAYLSGTLGMFRSIRLGLMSALSIPLHKAGARGFLRKSSRHSRPISFIARDIDRLTEHWDAESVPRAVASVAPEVGYWREPRSLPLAVLIRRGLTFQCRELDLRPQSRIRYFLAR